MPALTPGMDYVSAVQNIHQVADLTSLAAIDDSVLVNGTVVGVTTLGSFLFNRQATDTVDGISVLATLSGVGRWLRQPVLISTQALWFIHPTAGSDNNNGKTEGTALKTHAELARRLRGALILPPLVGPVRPWTVVLLGNLPTSDPVVPFGQATVGPDVIPQYIGAAIVATSSGTFTGVVGNPVRAIDRAANQPYQVTDAARTAPWGPELYQRIRITGGLRAGAISFVAEDLGANACVTLDWAIPAPYPFQGVTQVTPQIGDPYVVESLTELLLASGGFGSFTGNSSVVSVPFVGLTNIKVINTGAGATVLIHTGLMLNKCQISPNLLLFDSAFIFQSTAFLNGADFAGGGQYFMRSGGVFAKGGGGFSITGFTEMFITEATLFFADNDACCYGGPEWHIGVGGSFFFGGFVSTFKSVAKPFTASGHGMQILSGCTALFGLSSGSRFWGSGNAKKGVHVQAGGILAWGNGSPLNSLVPTVTGVAGDFAIGPLANVSSTTVDPAADPPVWLAKIANTWANLDTPAPIAAVAFGGNAIDALGGGRILKVGSTQIVTS